MDKKQYAREILSNIIPETVIDDNWYSYLQEGETLYALLLFTGCRSYAEILEKYEGITIKELLE